MFPHVSICHWWRCEEKLTDEEDGECDEEEEDMRHEVERVQETAVVQNPPVHIVGTRVILAPTERQGHGGTGTLHAASVRKENRRKRGKKRMTGWEGGGIRDR